MPTPDHFFSEHKTLVITGRDDAELTVVYDPAAVSYHDAPGKHEQDQLAAWIANVVVSWDLTGPLPVRVIADKEIGSVVPADEVIPLDPDKIAWLSMPTLYGLVGEIARDASPNRRRTAPASPKPVSHRTSTPSRSKRGG